MNFEENKDRKIIARKRFVHFVVQFEIIVNLILNSIVALLMTRRTPKFEFRDTCATFSNEQRKNANASDQSLEEK